MKILWFTNTPCGASEMLSPDNVMGGWLKSLEYQLSGHEQIDLHVCFYWGIKTAAFTHNKTNYHPVVRDGNGSKTGRLINRMLNRTYNDKQDFVKLLQVVNTVRPDVIHIHGTEENFGLIQAHTTIPVILSIQGLLSPISEKLFSGIPLTVINRFEGLKSKILFSSAQGAYKDLLRRSDRERKILSQAQYIIGRTDWDRRITGILASNRQYFVGNEMLRKEFYDNHWGKPRFENKLKIVTTTSDSLFKGLETVVKTCQILINSKIKFEWTIVGLSEKNHIAKIIKNWKSINYAQLHINLIGTKNETDLVNILVNSDIYCQVSHIENSPNSVCEAMLLGMPIIASFAGGTSTILKNNEEGILVQDGDPYSLAGAIKEMKDSFNQAIYYSTNAKRKAEKRHNKETITNELIEVYQTIIDKI